MVLIYAYSIHIIFYLLIVSKVSLAETIQIEFTEHDSYSIEIARIDVGDTIEWLPKNKGNNVEFLAGPKIDSLPTKSKIDKIHSVVFKVLGIYLYGCTPHQNMGMLGLIIVGNHFHNLEKVKNIQLPHVATSVLKRFIGIAQSDFKSS
jgi:pseudoazurin